MKVLLNNFSYYRNNNISPKQTFKGGANINGLYTKEDWNGIYRSGQILPWTKRGWTDVSIECIKPYISTEDEKYWIMDVVQELYQSSWLRMDIR